MKPRPLWVLYEAEDLTDRPPVLLAHSLDDQLVVLAEVHHQGYHVDPVVQWMDFCYCVVGRLCHEWSQGG